MQSLFAPGVLSGGLTSPTFPLLGYSIHEYSSTVCQSFFFHFLFLSSPVLKIVTLLLGVVFNAGGFFPKAVVKHMLATKDMGGRTSRLDY